MKKKLSMLLVVAATIVSLISCDLGSDDSSSSSAATGGETVVTGVPVAAKDGFALVASNVAFNAKTSVAILGASSTAIDEQVMIYAPTQFNALENGSDPIVTFTFSEALRAKLDEAVYSISTDGNTINGKTGVAKQNIFYIGATAIEAKSVILEANIVTFTFEAGTFSVEDEVKVVFGVTSESGEMYKVSTAFQPLADVITNVNVTPDFSDYYAYALDSNKLYFLNKELDMTHTTEYESAQDMFGITPIPGQDFGSIVNTVSKRFTNTSTGSPAKDFLHLKDLDDNGNTTTKIKLLFNPAPNATSHVIYYQHPTKDEVIRTEILPGLGAGEYTISEIFADDGITFLHNELIIDISTKTIITGDSLVVVPKNSRGEFTANEGSYVLTDNIRPYTLGQIDLTKSTSLNWTGEDFSSHIQNIADIEGEIVSFGTFDITSLTGWAAPNEGILYSLESHSLAPKIKGALPSIGLTKNVTAERVREVMNLTDDVELMSVGNSAESVIWASLDGTTLTVYVGVECKDGVSGINYAGETWEATGSVKIKATDLSGNILLYQNQIPTAIETGMFNITLN